MGWSKPVKNTRAVASVPRVTVRVSEHKNGGGMRLVVSITKALYEKMGQPVRADVMFGTDEHEGWLRLAYNRDGEFKFARHTNRAGKIGGGVSIQVPAAPDAPSKPFAGIRCGTFEVNDEELLVKLPVEEWRAAKPVRQKAA